MIWSVSVYTWQSYFEHGLFSRIVADTISIYRQTADVTRFCGVSTEMPLPEKSHRLNVHLAWNVSTQFYKPRRTIDKEIYKIRDISIQQ